MVQKLTYIIILFISLSSYSQSDSVKMKIVRVGTVDKKKVYWLKALKKDTTYFFDRNNFITVITRQRYVTVCECSKRRRGEIVSIAKKDLVIIKDSFTKKDLDVTPNSKRD